MLKGYKMLVIFVNTISKNTHRLGLVSYDLKRERFQGLMWFLIRDRKLMYLRIFFSTCLFYSLVKI